MRKLNIFFHHLRFTFLGLFFLFFLFLLTDFEDFRILSAIPSTKTLLKYCKAEDLDVIMSTLRENKLAYMERLGVHRSNVIITNGSKEKKLYAKKGEVLYDDYKKNIDEWISFGGTGVLVE